MEELLDKVDIEDRDSSQDIVDTGWDKEDKEPVVEFVDKAKGME